MKAELGLKLTQSRVNREEEKKEEELKVETKIGPTGTAPCCELLLTGNSRLINLEDQIPTIPVASQQQYATTLPTNLSK